MKHGDELPLETLDGPWVKDDPEMWIGLATPMDLWLAWERETCKCQARCKCDDWKEAEPRGKNP